MRALANLPIAVVAVAGGTMGVIVAGTTPGVYALPPDAPHPDAMVFEEITFRPPAPERWELPGGLAAHVLADDDLPLVSLILYVQAGAVDEPAERAGLAGLTGEVLRSGGSGQLAPADLDAALEDMASTLEITVGTERTVLAASMLERHAARTIELVFDLVRHPRFDAAKLEIARGLALEGLRRQNDHPRAVVERQHRALLYGRHPYGRTPTAETLAAIERQDLIDFHARHFGPHRMVLAVAGAIDPAALRTLLEDAIGDWQPPAVELSPIPPVPPVAAAGVPSVHHIEMDLSQSAIRVGHLGIDRYDPDRDAVAILDYVLGGGGFVSRLMQRLRVEEGIAYSARSDFTLPRDTGMFYAETQTRANQTVHAVELLIGEIRRLHDAGVSDAELADARSALVNRDIFRSVTPTQIAAQAASLEFDGYAPGEFERRIDAYRALDVETLGTVARRVLRPDSLVVLVVGKAADFDTSLSTIGPVHEIELP
ncbi:MAG: pitrilysin family protein [Candidatus Eiseniibacteriota bacterium]|jgi:predicted Zn-dependent peptidase